MRNSENLVSTSGDNAGDKALSIAIGRLGRFCGQYPGFSFMQDAGAPNACATPFQQFPNTDGTVLLGVQMYRQLTGQYQFGDFAVLMVLAHEFAHIAQFTADPRSRTATLIDRTLLKELQADFMAGFYLAELRRLYGYLDNRFASQMMQALGDFDFGSPDHHGTPDERLTAASTGYDLGMQEGYTFAGALEFAAKYVAGKFQAS